MNFLKKICDKKWFLEKMASYLVVSGLKFIFHWVDQFLILSKSLLKLFPEVWMSL